MLTRERSHGGPRCVRTTLPFADLPRQPAVLRAIVREAEENLGVDANVGAPATVAVGDRVELVE